MEYLTLFKHLVYEKKVWNEQCIVYMIKNTIKINNYIQIN